MKSTLAFILLILGSLSCQKTENAFDELTAADQAVIRARAEAKCLSSSAANYSAFSTESDLQYDGGSSDVLFRVNKYWKYTLKKNNVVVLTKHIAVWKTTATIVYLLFENVDAAGATTYQFVKVTKTTNDEMISDLKTKKCAGTLTISDTSSYFTASYNTTNRIDTSTRVYSAYTHTGYFNQLALFGRFNFSGRVESIDNNGATIGTADTMVGTTTLQSTDIVFDYSSYISYPAVSTKYCTIKYNSAVPNTYDFLTLSDADYLDCEPDPNAGPTGWATPSADL